MKHQLPQFIDVEDKLFGPLTFKQFIYIGGAAGIAFVLWRLLPPVFAIIIGLPIVAFGVSLAFVKINKRPFIVIVQGFLGYITKKRRFRWQQRHTKTVSPIEVRPVKAPSAPLPPGTHDMQSVANKLDIFDK